MLYNMLIKNGTIIDGSGKRRIKADIGITDGKIVEIDDLSGHCGERAIDANGLFVFPGFIDCHAHSDGTILVHPTGDSKVMQDVTPYDINHYSERSLYFYLILWMKISSS